MNKAYTRFIKCKYERNWSITGLPLCYEYLRTAASSPSRWYHIQRLYGVMISGRFGIIPWYEHHSFSESTFAISGTSPGWWNHMFSVYKEQFIWYILLGSLFYLLYWRQSRLKFCFQVTWLFSMTIPRDLEAHSLGCMTSNYGCWLEISLQWRYNERDDVSNYQPHDLSKCMHVTLCCTFHNKNAKKPHHSTH